MMKRLALAWRGLFAMLLLGACVGGAIAASPGALINDVINDRVRDVDAALRAGADPNTVDSRGNTLAIIAVRESAWTTLDRLMADPRLAVDQRNPFDETLLMYLAIVGDVNRTQRLLDRGAALEGPAWTALHYAATQGHDAVMSLLISRGARVDARAPDGSTALMLAARRGCLPCVQQLLRAGAETRFVREDGKDAADLALEGEHRALADALRERIDRDNRRSGR